MVKTCALPSCGRQFVADHHLQRYCSAACRQVVHAEQRAALASGRSVAPFYRPDEVRPQRRCGGCRRLFVPTNRYQAVCNLACADAANMPAEVAS